MKDWTFFLACPTMKKEINTITTSVSHTCTAIPYRASTGPEQGFPRVVNYYREPLFSLQGPCIHYREFPVRITTQGKSL